MKSKDVLFVILPIVAFVTFVFFAFFGFNSNYFFVGMVVGGVLLIILILRRVEFVLSKIIMDPGEDHFNFALIVLLIVFVLLLLFLKVAFNSIPLIVSIFF